ncbi:GGDEF domain-containing protein [Colwellia sp. MB3u-4]|uniref:GGDEF domain-containing protein n=1 Tax=Colwellia sp. MB3u-4 TaxID=2759822 RepID=UPI0015F6E4E3|nr:GGDEF domain-containing protein [Colwellia sp. MB3u-4]MBA6289303.1 GGDEF domain-containing protein [Colwellia sp. MB3u-4]
MRLFLKLIVILNIYFSFPVFAQLSSAELFNQISLRQDFYNDCLFDDLEAQIDANLKRSDEFSIDNQAILLYSKATQHMCRNEFKLADNTFKKLINLPENKINKNYYMAALLELGVNVAISQSGDECQYINLAFKKIIDETHHNIKFLIQRWHISYCEGNQPVIILRKLYQLLKTLEQNNYLHLKTGVLHEIANQFANIGQASTAAKIRDEAINLTIKLNPEGINVEDYFNLTKDYIDAGDIVNAEQSLDNFLSISHKQKDDSYLTKLKLILTTTLAYEKQDFITMKSATDEMYTLFNDVDNSFNSNKMNILRVIACYETKGADCVDAFMSNIEQHLNHPIDGKNTWLIKFLVTYYIENEQLEQAQYFFELYTQETKIKLIEQQSSAQVLGVAQLNQNIVEMNLRLAQNNLKTSRITIYIIAFIAFITIFIAVLFWHLSKRHKYLSETDTLTNIANRRAIFKALTLLEMPAKDLIHAIVMFDLDNFKNINDTYGHTVGDLALQHIVKQVKQNIRKNDVFGRIGGEEFLICLKNMDAELARNMIERMRKSFESSTIILEDGTELSITASFSLYLLDKPIASFESIYQHLDAGLYEAKKLGRNVIIEV